MSPPTEWGPPVWTLFHTFAEKINPNKFSELAPQFFFILNEFVHPYLVQIVLNMLPHF